jgi:hypothetical protein
MNQEGFSAEERFSEEDEAALSLVTDRDIQNPIMWLESLTPFQLKSWLRRAIWAGLTLPLGVPPTALLVPYIDETLKEEALKRAEVERDPLVGLTTNLRVAIPALLAEWGSRDPGHCLDDLLVLCAKLRCAGATPSLMSIATERLVGRSDEVRLRQRCLSVLAGLDVTEQTVPVFNRFLDDFPYTAFCYRALYRNNLGYACSKLPVLLSVYGARRAYDQLRAVLHLFLFGHLNKTQREENFWKSLLLQSRPEVLREVLRGLQNVHITVLPPPESYAYQNHVEVTYLSPEELRPGRPTMMDKYLSPEELRLGRPTIIDNVNTERMKLPTQKVILDCGREYTERYGKALVTAA